MLGSRDLDRADAVALELAPHAPRGRVRGGLNLQVALQAEVPFITVPYPAQRELLTALQKPLAGKVVVSTAIPLAFARGQARAVPVKEGSAAQEAQALLPRSKVVSAFQNLSAHDLLVPDRALEADVVVCADDPEAKRLVMALAEAIAGVRAIDGGGLENARYVEELTALLLNLNRIYKGSRTMIRIVGLNGKPGAS